MESRNNDSRHALTEAFIWRGREDSSLVMLDGLVIVIKY